MIPTTIKKARNPTFHRQCDSPASSLWRKPFEGDDNDTGRAGAVAAVVAAGADTGCCVDIGAGVGTGAGAGAGADAGADVEEDAVAVAGAILGVVAGDVSLATADVGLGGSVGGVSTSVMVVELGAERVGKGDGSR